MKRLAWVAVLAVATVFAVLLAVADACDPPDAGINGIFENCSVSGTVPVEVEVKAVETTVRGVDLYVDGNLVESINKAPYQEEVDTTRFKDGDHKVYAKVRSLDRPDGVSSTISFTVSNSSEVPEEHEG
jgi:hypothetical protein